MEQPEIYASLYQYMKKAGAEGVDNVEIADYGHPWGRGLRCKQPIAGGTCFLKVPKNVLITTDNLSAHAALRGIYEALDAYDDVTKLAVYLLYLLSTPDANEGDVAKQSQQEDGDRVYAATLPKEVQGNFLTDKAAQENIRILYQNLQENVLGPSAPSLAPSFATASLEAFLLAYSNVVSRAMTFGDRLILVPLADMLNHLPSPTNNQYHLFATSDQAVYVYARYDYSPGEQITINYGQNLPNSVLHYGFSV